MENQIVTRQSINDYMKSFGIAETLSNNERDQFANIAEAYNLNPFKREIYCLAYGEGDKRKLSIITGFEVYLKRAERSGNLDGWKVWTEGESRPVEKTVERYGKNGKYTKKIVTWEGNLKACIEIHRKDRSKPFYHEVYLSEYTQENEMWAGKPITMIKKVAMAQGFRLCFPDELGGIPYTADELPDEMTTPRNITPEPAQDQTVTLPEFSGPAETIENTPHKKEPLPVEKGKTTEDSILLEIAGVVKDWTDTEKAELKPRIKAIGRDRDALGLMLEEVKLMDAMRENPVVEAVQGTVLAVKDEGVTF